MKKSLLLVVALVFAFAYNASAQIKGQEMEQYRRSSLCMVMLEDPNLDPEAAKIVRETFMNNPLPAKYNDHCVGKEVCTFSFNDIQISQEDKDAYRAFIGKKPEANGVFAELGKELLGELVQLDPLREDAPAAAWKYLMTNDFAKKVAWKWFGVDNDQFNYELIKERAVMNATELEKQAAAEETMGRDVADYIMANGGFEVISNTFIPVTRFGYKTAEEMANEVEKQAHFYAAFIPLPPAQQAAKLAGTAAAMVIKQIGGYFVKTNTYLYRLKWNEEVKTIAGQAAFDVEKFKALDCFELEFVGDETAHASTAQQKGTDEEVIARATVRAIDKALAKLEKKYEVFRTKTPLATVTPTMTAYIGTKECVQKGDKYEILMREIDPKTNKETYKSVGKITVDIVGNTLGELNDDDKASQDPFTTFKGKAPKKATSGLLIRQL